MTYQDYLSHQPENAPQACVAAYVEFLALCKVMKIPLTFSYIEALMKIQEFVEDLASRIPPSHPEYSDVMRGFACIQDIIANTPIHVTPA